MNQIKAKNSHLVNGGSGNAAAVAIQRVDKLGRIKGEDLERIVETACDEAATGAKGLEEVLVLERVDYFHARNGLLVRLNRLPEAELDAELRLHETATAAARHSVALGDIRGGPC